MIKNSVIRAAAVCAVLMWPGLSSRASAQNMITNGDFSAGSTAWSTWTNWPAQASYDIGGTYQDARATILEGGTANWHVQLYQAGMTMEYGKSYEISFDATTFGHIVEGVLDVECGKNGGDYRLYMNPQTVHVNPGVQTFTFTFQMLQPTDHGARIAFNLGNNPNPGGGYHVTIGIDNVSIRQVPGNMIVNGDFSAGAAAWTTWLHWNANASVTVGSPTQDGRASILYGGGTHWGVQLYQGGLHIEYGKTYELSLYGTTSSKTMSAELQVVVEEYGGDYTHYMPVKTVTLNPGDQNFTWTFQMMEPTDHNARLTFNMGNNQSPGDNRAVVLWVDNVFLREVPGNMVVNGGFERGGLAWGTYISSQASASFSIGSDARALIYDGGDECWHVQLAQAGLLMKQGQAYKVTFDALTYGPVSAGVIDAVVQKSTGDYKTYGPVKTFTVGPVSQTFSFTFTMQEPTDNDGRLTFNFGCNSIPGGGYHHEIAIDNVALYPVNSETAILNPVKDAIVRTDLDVRRNDNYGCDWVLLVGDSRGGGGIPWGGPDGMRSLIQFDLSSITSPVSSAVLKLYHVTGNPADQPREDMEITVHRLLDMGELSPWIEGNGAENEARPEGCVHTDPAEGVSWAGGGDGGDANNQTQPDFDPEVFARRSIPASQALVNGQIVEFDITSLVNGWIDGTWANEGLVLRENLGGSAFSYLFFGSREGETYDFGDPRQTSGPKLEIIK